MKTMRYLISINLAALLLMQGLSAVSLAQEEAPPQTQPNAEALPEGHPPISPGELPPGHPPMDGDTLPPGHPPMDGETLPEGHPELDSSGLPPGHPPMDGSSGMSSSQTMPPGSTLPPGRMPSGASAEDLPAGHPPLGGSGMMGSTQARDTLPIPPGAGDPEGGEWPIGSRLAGILLGFFFALGLGLFIGRQRRDTLPWAGRYEEADSVTLTRWLRQLQSGSAGKGLPADVREQWREVLMDRLAERRVREQQPELFAEEA